MNKVYYTDKEVRTWVHAIIRQMGDWRPDYVVGLTRGGLVPANMISQYFDIRMETLKVSLRDDSETESNCWMAEDAFGYVPADQRGESGTQTDPAYRKNILIVDDINDSGATLNWIKRDWQSSCLPDHAAWDRIWNNNVKFATLVNNTASVFKNIDYYGTEINKFETPVWCVFPWEEWWAR
jgi:hypoxanthine phosphoribosyltransferase